MHRFAVACAIALSLSAGPVLSAEESCRDAVATAFNKQRASRAFTMESELKAANGPVTITVEYLPPDRMRQQIIAPGQPAPLETVLVGTRAWSRQGGAWEELMPAIAQTIIAQVREAIIEPPKDVADFACIDAVTIAGKQYLAYRSIEKSGGEAKGSEITKPVHRTIYVDPDTGLPAMNIVAEDSPDATPLFKAVYAYPTDLVIEGHPDAPLAKIR